MSWGPIVNRMKSAIAISDAICIRPFGKRVETEREREREKDGLGLIESVVSAELIGGNQNKLYKFRKTDLIYF